MDRNYARGHSTLRARECTAQKVSENDKVVGTFSTTPPVRFNQTMNLSPFAVLTRAARRRLCESGHGTDDLLSVENTRRKRCRRAAFPPPNPLNLLPAALQVELFFEWLNEPRDLARIEVASSPPPTGRRRCFVDNAAAAGELRAQRVLSVDELAWLRARGVRVRLFAEVRVGSCFFRPSSNCIHCSWGFADNAHRLREWLLNGELHRDNDLPALEMPVFRAPPVILPKDDDDFDPATAPAPPLIRREWYQHGVLHRDGDLPARQWFEYGTDGSGGVDWAHPVLVEQEFFQHGLLHRDGDKPAREMKIFFDHPFTYSPNLTPSCTVLVWYRRGKLHRGGDRPAMDCSDGVQLWFWNGRKHRGGDRPAVVHPGNRREWWRSGTLRRGGSSDGPTTVCSDGTLTWHCTHSHIHRGGDLPAIVRSDGSRMWYTDGLMHRDGDRPAVEAVDCLKWYRRGELHRDGDRAAVIVRRRLGRHPRPRIVLEYWRKGWPHDSGRQKSCRREQRRLVAGTMLDEANARCAAVAAAVAANEQGV